jgi:L-lactate dehydrogenase
VIKDMKPFNPAAILLLIANPVDILAYFALQYSGLPRTQVIGSGTFLDSARLRGALAAETGVAASSIDAFVIGEHGESQVVSPKSKNRYISRVQKTNNPPLRPPGRPPP